eukprot:s134_g13.t1
MKGYAPSISLRHQRLQPRTARVAVQVHGHIGFRWEMLNCTPRELYKSKDIRSWQIHNDLGLVSIYVKGFRVSDGNLDEGKGMASSVQLLANLPNFGQLKYLLAAVRCHDYKIRHGP